MEKDIRFTGFTAVPSDYECSDGELTQAYNLINEDGAFKSLLAPKVIFDLVEYNNVIYVHKATTYAHYIIHDTENKKLLWTSDGSNLTDLYNLGSNVLYQVVGIGNTLIVLTADGMHYLLWKNATDGYLYLGTHLPELPISFGLQGEMVKTDDFTISFDSISEGDIWKEFSDDNKTKITNQVLAKVNKFIADKSTNAGKFIYPFLVRYAYRLYDGSLTMHSAPVLMICSSDLAPQVAWSHISGKGSYKEATLCVMSVLHSIDYAVCLSSRIDLLKQWKDIVRSVDIFISKPIYTYDQNGQCTQFVAVDDSDCYCVCKHINQAASTSTYPLRYQVNRFSKMYAFTFNPTDLTYRSARLVIPKRSAEQVKADIRSCSQFYFLKSIELDELSTERTVVEVEEDYLQSLVTREVMTDDYDSHDTLIPRYSFGYNSRMNIANLKKRLYNLFNTGAMVCHTDGYVANFSGSSPTIWDDKHNVSVYYYIKQDGRDIIVQGESFPVAYNAPFLFLFYPNINAYKAVIYGGGPYSTINFEVPLEAHGFINGAFYFGGWENSKKSISSYPSPSSDAQRTIDIPNKIYTSEVNNPFHFPVLGINTVGTGTIIGISAAAKALSQGQFGQFPLYAFTDEGVWALEVNSSGGYSAKQPITRDVCISSESITQIDSAVLFATDRGIMEISGSQTQCITDIIDGDEYFKLDRLPGLSKLYPDSIPQVDCTFSEYRKSAKMIYDYVNQRIIVFNATKNYAYVFSMKTKLWGIMASSLTTSINLYPKAYAMAQVKTIEGEGDNKNEVISNCLVDLSRSEETHNRGLLVTRPIKLEAGSTLKTFDTVFLRGLFDKGKVQVVLYGSRDNIRWHLIHSAKEHYLRGFSGTPYKFFRIVAITDLSVGETLVGASISYTQRFTNQIR